MKPTELLAILIGCQDKQENTLEGTDCEACPLSNTVEVTPAIEGYGSISRITLYLSPCMLINEAAGIIRVAPVGEKKHDAQH